MGVAVAVAELWLVRTPNDNDTVVAALAEGRSVVFEAVPAGSECDTENASVARVRDTLILTDFYVLYVPRGVHLHTLWLAI